MLLLVALATLIGVSLGLLGGGGSILTVPILVYVAGLEPADGIATSLLVVGATSLTAMLVHARRRRVAWKVGALFGTASMMGAYAGGRVAHFVAGRDLLIAFTGLMVVTAAAMMRPRRAASTTRATELSTRVLVTSAAVGLGIGTVTGLVGAGGGFVIVPALVLLGGLPMRTAVGTSLMVIAMNSFAGFAGAASHTTIPWGLALAVGSASVAGSFLGATLSERVHPEVLRASFAWFVLAMACFMALKQLPPSVLVLADGHRALLLGLSAFAALAVGLLVRAQMKRRTGALARP